ncbi:MAG: Outer membrane protein assembly factor BamD [Actinobacteria bacterium ADurb.Bin346]|nr:MAG: Outer membrane protein assembly factor BamD [Actinobacteria bacterium ADurb.Bin346]
MQLYDRPRLVLRSAIFYISFFVLVFIGIGYFFFSDRGKFFDFLPYFCIPGAILNLVLLIFYFVKRNMSGYIFAFFFLFFIAGMIISSFKGPFPVASSADEHYTNKNYSQAAAEYEYLLDKYPTSKYADTALKKLPYSHYLASDYSKTIFYLEKAIEKGLINQNELEIKTIFADCYVQLARNPDKNGNIREAISNYLKSIEYLREIGNNFPDSNEAFIAKYKIPEYLLNTASLYRGFSLG